jgi:hypothetical protein
MKLLRLSSECNLMLHMKNNEQNGLEWTKTRAKDGGVGKV